MTKCRRHHATFPSTLRSSTLLFSAGFLPSSCRREYRRGPFIRALSLSLSLVFSSQPSFFLQSLLRGSLPCTGCSSRMAKTTQLWDTRGESRGLSERQAVIHSAVFVVDRDYCSPDDYNRARSEKQSSKIN